VSELVPTFKGEVQLAGWSDTHNGGAKVTFWLPDRDELAPFAGLTARKGNTAGHRFMMVLVEIGDDDQPANQPKGGPLSRLAGQWCGSPEFRAWLASNVLHTGRVIDEDEAATQLRSICAIDSRAQLDSEPAARQLFDSIIRLPFRAYCEQVLGR
jgi:hypothetical protein